MVQCDLHIGEYELEVLKELTLETNDFSKRRKKAVPLSILEIVLCLAASIGFFLIDEIVFSIFFMCAGIFFIYMLCGGMKRIQRSNLDKFMRNQDKALREGTRHYTFDSDGIQSSSNLGRAEYKWNAFKSWGTAYHYIYVMKVDNQVVLVDQKSLSENELEEVKTLLGNVAKGIDIG